MNVDAHVSELKRKHADLSRVVEEEQRALGSNDLEIVRLKREKLRLKEEIVRLSPVN